MKKILVVLFALVSAQAFGQAYSSTVLQNSAGNYGRPVPYPQVLVCAPGDTNVPCISRATTYFDDTLTTQCTQTGSSGLLIGNPTSGPNCNNPGIGDVNGNFTIYVAGGEYTICTYSGTWLCQKQTIGGGNSGTGVVNSCTGGSNCDAYFPIVNVPSVFGDPLATDDGAGNKTGKSFTTTQAGIAGFHYFTQGSPPSLSVNNTVYFYAPVSVSTYAWILPVAAGSGCLQGTAVGNLVTIAFTGVACGSGSGATLQTNTVNNSSQALLNFTTSPTIVPSNPSGGIEQFSITGSAQASNPNAPTVTPKGTTGGTSYSYGVVGCQDVVCNYHSAISPTGSTSTGNATLTTGNFNQLTAYADTLYGYRGILFCRLTGGSNQGVITGTHASPQFAGKIFNDTGLTADGTNCATNYAINTTMLLPVCLGSAVPGTPTTPGFPCGVDGPPLAPTAFDHEFGQNFGAPADVNDGVWAWLNQGGATASWSGGALSFTPDTGGTGYRLLLTPTPVSAPWAFTAQITPMTPTNFARCGLALEESATGKMVEITFQQNQALTTTSTQNGIYLEIKTWSNSTTSADTQFSSYQWYGPVYFRASYDGTNIKFFYSLDGVGYSQLFSAAATSWFTSAPNRVGFEAVAGSSSIPAVCDIDYIRRTQ